VNAADAWVAGESIDGYVAQLWRKHRRRFAVQRERTIIPEELAERLQGRELRILVVTEPYCEDSSQFVPVVWKLSQSITDMELRILRQSAQPGFAARYLAPAGHPAIPVFVLLDQQLKELGALIERPSRVTADMAAAMRGFQREHSELPGITRTLERMPEETQIALKQHLSLWRDTQHLCWTQYLLEDLVALADSRLGVPDEQLAASFHRTLRAATCDVFVAPEPDTVPK
jgi:hypothetical protein